MSVSGLYLGTRALQAQQIALEVTGQNIANVDTEGYTRQRAHFVQSEALQKSYGMLGTGVQVDNIEQIKDRFLDAQIRDQTSETEKNAVLADSYDRIEKIFNEPSDSSISGLISNFYEALNDLANDPEAIGVRDALVIQAQALTSQIQYVDNELDQLRLDLNGEIVNSVTEINSLTQQIADLNTQIVRIEAGTLTTANDLRDQRDQALKELSEIVAISTSEQESGDVNVSINGLNVVFGGTSYELDVQTKTGDELPVQEVIIASSGAVLNPTGGSLAGLIEARDTNVVNYQDDLDTLSRAIIDEINKIHVNGNGLDGFSSLTSANGVDDTSIALEDTDLDITPVDTSFNINILDESSGSCTETSLSISVDVSTDSLADVRDAINTALTGAGISEVTASINSDNQLVITSSDSDFTFSFGDVTSDSSNFLCAIGMNTFFTGTDASNIDVNQTIVDSPEFVAAGQSSSDGDNTNASLMADTRSQQLISGGTRTLEEFYQSTIVSLGADVSQASVNYETSSSFLEQLTLERESVSGVSIDEEAANLIKYQRFYEAAARYISVVDELLNVLVNGIV